MVLLGKSLGQLFSAMIFTALVVAVVGGVLGIFQAGVVEAVGAKLWRWLAATIVGTGAGLALAVVLVEASGRAQKRRRTSRPSVWRCALSSV